MEKPHVTIFVDGGEPFIAMHIDGDLRGLWCGQMFTGAGEVLKELVLTGHATIAVIGKEAQKAWDAVKTARVVMAEIGLSDDKPSAP